MPSTHESCCGTHLGPYALQSRLGGGGMGEVYQARDTKLSRDEALKILPAPGWYLQNERKVVTDDLCHRGRWDCRRGSCQAA